jgi:hypothetical protein
MLRTADSHATCCLGGIPHLPASERRSCVESLHETSSEQPGPAREASHSCDLRLAAAVIGALELFSVGHGRTLPVRLSSFIALDPHAENGGGLGRKRHTTLLKAGQYDEPDPPFERDYSGLWTVPPPSRPCPWWCSTCLPPS